MGLGVSCVSTQQIPQCSMLCCLIPVQYLGIISVGLDPKICIWLIGLIYLNTILKLKKNIKYKYLVSVFLCMNRVL